MPGLHVHFSTLHLPLGMGAGVHICGLIYESMPLPKIIENFEKEKRASTAKQAVQQAVG